MKVSLVRHTLGPTFTLGSLYVNNTFQCFTLEDEARLDVGLWKVYGHTAIPQGAYGMILAKSVKFDRIMPKLLDVPQFEGVLLHWGNVVTETDGCPLTGEQLAEGKVIRSKAAFTALMAKLRKGTTLSIEVMNLAPLWAKERLRETLAKEDA